MNSPSALTSVCLLLFLILLAPSVPASGQGSSADLDQFLDEIDQRIEWAEGTVGQQRGTLLAIIDTMLHRARLGNRSKATPDWESGRSRIEHLKRKMEFSRWSSGPTVKSSAEPPGSTGTFSGNTSDADTSSPIADQVIDVYSAGGQYIQTEFTNAIGDYAVGPLAAGTYFAIAGSQGGYLPELYSELPCLPGSCVPTNGTPILVSAGANTSAIDFTQTLGGTLSGNASDADTGLPIPNQWIEIVTQDGFFAAFTSTDAAGNFTARALHTGDFYARAGAVAGYIPELYAEVACPFFDCSFQLGTSVSVVAGSDSSGVNFTQDLGGAIAGTVSDASSSLPIQGQSISVFTSDGRFASSGFTDSAGVYSAGSLPDGSYYARAEANSGYVPLLYDGITCSPFDCELTAGDLISVTQGSSTGGIDFSQTIGGSIAGVVTDASNGSPIPFPSVRVFSDTSSAQLFADSFLDGSYTVGGLPTGSYKVTAIAPNYAGELYDGHPCPDGRTCNLAPGDDVDVTTGVVTSGIDFGLDDPGSISGSLTTGGNPLFITVQLFSSNGDYLGATSGSDYRFDQLTSGDYLVRTADDTFVNKVWNDIVCEAPCDPTIGDLISVLPGTETTDIDFDLARKGAITGTVRDEATGQPVEGVVLALNEDGAVVGATYISPGNGFYSLYLPPGSYYIRTASESHTDEIFDDIECSTTCPTTLATAVVVATGISTADFRLTVLSSAPFEASSAATTIDRHKHLDRDLVQASLRISWARREISQLSSRAQSAAVTDVISSTIRRALEEARQLDEPVAAAYRRRALLLQVELDRLQMDLRAAARSSLHAPTNHQTSGPTGSFSGSATDAGSSDPIVGQFIDIFDVSGFFVETAFTDAAGAFIATVDPGTYFAIAGSSAGYVPELYSGTSCAFFNCDPTSGSPIVVTAGSDTPGIDFTQDIGGSLSGTVVDLSSGAPVAGQFVDVFLTDGGYATTGFADGLGSYVVSGLTTGSYYARAASREGYTPLLFDGIACPFFACNPQDGDLISVTQGADTPDIDFEQTLGGSISGTVTDVDSGQPVQQSVVIYREDDSFATSGFADPSGNYSAGGLPSGTYYARASNQSGYVPQLYESIPCPFSACSPSSGTPISVTQGNNVSGIDFAQTLGGTVTGTVTDSSTSNPIPFPSVRVFPDDGGSFSVFANRGADGIYTAGGLPTGDVKIVATATGYAGELYDDLPCPNLFSCNREPGTPVSITEGSTTADIDFALDLPSSITGSTTSGGFDVFTTLQLFSEQGDFLEATGGATYTFSLLKSGRYFVRTASIFLLDEIWDDVICEGPCNATDGTPIDLTSDEDRTGVDFDLERKVGVTGTVVDATTGQPATGVVVALDSGGAVVTAAPISGFNGSYALYLLPGDYYIHTATVSNVNEIFEDIQCPSTCDTAGATLVTVGSTLFTQINFFLDSAPEPGLIFTDGFESGNTSRWASP